MGAKGVLMVHQLKSFDWPARWAKKAGTAPPEVTEAASEIIRDIVAYVPRSSTEPRKEPAHTAKSPQLT